MCFLWVRICLFFLPSAVPRGQVSEDLLPWSESMDQSNAFFSPGMVEGIQKLPCSALEVSFGVGRATGVSWRAPRPDVLAIRSLRRCSPSALAAAPFGNRSPCQTHGDRWNIWNMFPAVMTPIVFFTGARPQFPCFDKGRGIYLSCHFLKLPSAPIFLSRRSSGPSGCCSAPLAVLLTTSSLFYLHQPPFFSNHKKEPSSGFP